MMFSPTASIESIHVLHAQTTKSMRIIPLITNSPKDIGFSIINETLDNFEELKYLVNVNLSNPNSPDYPFKQSS
jgi:hypothetical protein